MIRRTGTNLSSFRQGHGFSLVEMAIVLVLMSIMLTMGVAAFDAQQRSAALTATNKKQEIIKDALIAYLRVNRQLPCPETTGLPGTGQPPSGSETRPSATPPLCSSYVGTLPWLNLGLAKDVALDGYGNFFTYYVATSKDGTDPDWTLKSDPTNNIPGFSVGNPGRFADSSTSLVNGLPVPPLAVAVLVSHGKNGFGAITEKGTRIDSSAADQDELPNIPPSAPLAVPAWNDQSPNYIPAVIPAAPPSASTIVASSKHSGYDDIVMVLRPNDLLTPIIKDGAFKSAQAEVQDTLSTAIGVIANSACTPPAHSLSAGQYVPNPPIANWPNDPWGNPIQYYRKSSLPLSLVCPSSDITCAGPNNNYTTSAFRVFSLGPNRKPDSDPMSDLNPKSDDIPPRSGWDISYQTMNTLPVSRPCP